MNRAVMQPRRAARQAHHKEVAARQLVCYA